MAKQEPDSEAKAIINNARHGNEFHKPYDQGNAVTAANKLYKLSLQGQATQETNKEPIASHKSYATTLYKPCKDKIHRSHKEFQNG